MSGPSSPRSCSSTSTEGEDAAKPNAHSSMPLAAAVAEVPNAAQHQAAAEEAITTQDAALHAAHGSTQFHQPREAPCCCCSNHHHHQQQQQQHRAELRPVPAQTQHAPRTHLHQSACLWRQRHWQKQLRPHVCQDAKCQHSLSCDDCSNCCTPVQSFETKSTFTTSETNISSTPAGYSCDSNPVVNPETCPAAAVEATGIGQAVDPHAVLLSGSGAFATVLPPIVCPEACRELVYTFQDCPGHGASLDPAEYLEALVTYMLQQQEKDYMRLHGSVGGLKALSKPLMYGCLQHSTSACIYFMPPHGPSRTDLALMAGLSQHVALLTVVGKADAMTAGEAADCCRAVQHMLAEPAEYVPGIPGGASIAVYRPSASGEQSGAEHGCLPLLLCTRAAADAASGYKALDGLTSLLEVIGSDEVYGLLDHSSNLFISFSGAYEAAGKRLKVLADKACEEAEQHLMPRSSTASAAWPRSTGAGGLPALVWYCQHAYVEVRTVVLILFNMTGRLLVLMAALIALVTIVETYEPMSP